jgi:hypothetical protein
VLKPPSTQITAPVTKPAARSLTRPDQCADELLGLALTAHWRVAQDGFDALRRQDAAVRSAGKKPGTSALTGIRCGPSSRARYRVRLLRPLSRHHGRATLGGAAENGHGRAGVAQAAAESPAEHTRAAHDRRDF